MELGLMDRTFALHYALETYVRRDVMFVMSKVFGDGKQPQPTGKVVKLIVPQEEIREWVEKQYEEDDKG